MKARAKDGKMRLTELKHNGNNKQAGIVQRLSGMEENCIDSQGPQRPVVLENKRTRTRRRKGKEKNLMMMMMMMMMMMKKSGL